MKKVLVSLACLVVLAGLYACSNIGNDDLKSSYPTASVTSER